VRSADNLHTQASPGLSLCCPTRGDIKESAMISAKARKLLSGMAASTVVLARGFAHVQQGPRGHCPLEGVSLVRAVDRPMSGLWRTQVLVRILVGARALVMPIRRRTSGCRQVRWQSRAGGRNPCPPAHWPRRTHRVGPIRREAGRRAAPGSRSCGWALAGFDVIARRDLSAVAHA